MKVCTKCNLEKSIDEFPTFKSRTPGAPLLYSGYCKTCKNNFTIIQCRCGKPKHKKSEMCGDCRKRTYIKNHKLCPACGVEKPYSEYHMRKEKGGYQTPKSYCKECCKAKRRKIIHTEVSNTWCLCACGKLIETRSKTCLQCNRKLRRVDHTKEDALYDRTARGSLIRYRARSICSKKACENCSYSLHTEVCHIKAVKLFDSKAKLSEINHPENLISLCPNCHWEFDHGYLTLDQIRRNNDPVRSCTEIVPVMSREH